MATWTGKLVGGLIGMLTLGPFGAALGVALGHQYDANVDRERNAAGGAGTDPQTAGEQLFRSTFRVMGKIAKADGRVSEQEIAAARAVMAELRLDPAQVRAAIEHFTAGKQPTFDLDAELEQLRRACGDRRDLLRIFLEIQVRAALAGNNLEPPARAALQRTARALGFSLLELAHIEAVLRIRSGSFSSREAPRTSLSEQLDQAYEVLGVSPQASNEEIAKAYRRQLSRHHPDKLKANGLPESMIEHAKQRTQQIIEAYELIRGHRGM